MFKKGKGFTLIELVVVVTLLSILAAISFVSFKGYARKSRDAARLSDVNLMQKALETYSFSTGKYPNPDDGKIMDYDGDKLWTQGFFGESVVMSLSKTMVKPPLDPLTGENYVYSLLNNRSEYQILALYEGEKFAYNYLINTAIASGNGYPRVTGNYNGLFVETSNYIVPVPSIINSEIDGANITLNGTNIKSQVVTGQTNIPKIGYFQPQIRQIPNLNLSIYTGKVDNNTDDSTKATVMQTIQDAYKDSEIKNKPEIKYILDATTDNQRVALIDSVVLDNGGFLASRTSGAPPVIYSCTGSVPSSNVSTSNTTGLTSNTPWQNSSSSSKCYYECTGGFTGSNCDVSPVTGWRSVDPNCGIDDITIGSQTWAGCNSTLGNGFERGQTNADIGTSNYSGSSGDCYNYDGVNSLAGSFCLKGNANMASDITAKNFFDSRQPDGSNQYSDVEFDTIWGKLYTWSEAIKTDGTGPCRGGYRLPTDAEWTTLENTINGSSCRTGGQWQCDGLGWKGHNAKTDSNNLANALKIPLAGNRSTNGVTFNSRGYNTLLWSSTPVSSSNAYFRGLYWNVTTIFRYHYNRTYGFSVRCIKD